MSLWVSLIEMSMVRVVLDAAKLCGVIRNGRISLVPAMFRHLGFYRIGFGYIRLTVLNDPVATQKLAAWK
ncbi:hypothetical protein CRM95_25195 [Burkholderia gladioli]|nr:hypothetical protein CRM95_25195 [Burkholderia gladioli]